MRIAFIVNDWTVFDFTLFRRLVAGIGETIIVPPDVKPQPTGYQPKPGPWTPWGSTVVGTIEPRQRVEVRQGDGYECMTTWQGCCELALTADPEQRPVAYRIIPKPPTGGSAVKRPAPPTPAAKPAPTGDGGLRAWALKDGKPHEIEVPPARPFTRDPDRMTAAQAEESNPFGIFRGQSSPKDQAEITKALAIVLGKLCGSTKQPEPPKPEPNWYPWRGMNPWHGDPGAQVRIKMLDGSTNEGPARAFTWLWDATRSRGDLIVAWQYVPTPYRATVQP